MERKSIFITGATGMIGVSVVNNMLRKGYCVTAFARSKKSWPFEEHPNLRCAIGTMQDADSLQKAIDGNEYVVHLAAAKNDERESEATNVEGTRNLIAACKKTGIKLIINISTQSVKLKKRGIYGQTKLVAEQLLKEAKVPLITLRPSIVYKDKTTGIIGSIIKFSRLPVIPVIGSGKIHFWPVHVDDIAIMIEKALEKREMIGNVYDVGGSKAITFNSLIDEVLRRTKKKKWKLHLPICISMVMAKSLEFLSHPPITISNVRGATEDIACDTTLIQTLLEFHPRTLQEGLDQILINPRTYVEKEAEVLMQYVLSAFGRHIIPDRLIHRYKSALAQYALPSHSLDEVVLRHPYVLSGLDLFTRWKRPKCMVRKKLQIAAAMVECDPLSSSDLLPKNMSYTSIFIIGIKTGIRLITIIPLALCFFCMPGFIKRNAGI